MPAFETMDRYQTAVLWEVTSLDHYNEPVLGTPEEVSVRWVDRPTQVMGPDNTLVTVDATVVVDQDVALNSHMWLGTLDDWYEAGSAGNDAKVMVVVAAPKTYDLKGRNIRRTLGLKYFRSTENSQ